LVKQSYGPWMLKAFRALARLKFLRGTAFDLFGRTAERRAERQLIEDYLALLEEFRATLTLHNVSMAIELASLPDQIRGFGHVKEHSISIAKKRREELIEQYRRATSQRAVA
jgi:indolepyruvate ferredoxin oxidoreductase